MVNRQGADCSLLADIRTPAVPGQSRNIIRLSIRNFKKSLSQLKTALHFPLNGRLAGACFCLLTLWRFIPCRLQ